LKGALTPEKTGEGMELFLKVLGIGENGGHIAGESSDARICLAASLLLLEAARASSSGRTDMPGRVVGALLTAFPLPQDYIERLIALAGAAPDSSQSLMGLASQFNQCFGPEQRALIAEAAWRVVYSDQDLSDMEEPLSSLLSHMLWVDEGTLSNARLRAQKSSEQGPEQGT
jgi:uncharacterized tellurite resistance protein B-like protein